MATQYQQYNGQNVVVGDEAKTRLQNSVAEWNKTTGQNLTAEQYDQKLNPTTYGARWGSPESSMPNYQNPSPSAREKTPTYEAAMQTVSDKSTVQNQLAGLLSSGSKLNTMAEQEANRAMNRRGLLSSSLAVGAAQDAVVKNALPIAQQDASTYANADSNNAQFENSSRQWNANAGLQKQLALIQSDTSLTVADKQIRSQQLIAENENKNKLQLQQLDADTKKALATMDDASKTKLAQLDADNKQLLQTNISAANAYAQLAQALANISTSTTMDAAAKQQATDNQINLFKQTLQGLGQVSGLDLSKYFQQIQASTSEQGGSQANTGGGGGGADSSGRPGMNGSLDQWG